MEIKMNNYSEKEIEAMKGLFLPDKETLKEHIHDHTKFWKELKYCDYMTKVGILESDLFYFLSERAINDYFWEREDEKTLDFKIDEDGCFLTYGFIKLCYDESDMCYNCIALLRIKPLSFETEYEDYDEETDEFGLMLYEYDEEVVECIAMIPELYNGNEDELS